MHSDVSGNTAATPAELIASLDMRLRELASRSERLWIKLGDCMFPGIVEQQAARHGGRQFTVTARAHDHRVRQALMSINESSSNRGELRLTWPNESHPVEVTSVKQTQHFVGEVDVEVACRLSQNYYAGGAGRMMVTSSGVSPEEETERWLRQVLFGEARKEAKKSYMPPAIDSDGPSLLDVLSSTRAVGWQAEGVTRLYAIEELARKCNGRFTHLDVGSTTSTGIPLTGEFTLEQYGQQTEAVAIQGVVPLPR